CGTRARSAAGSSVRLPIVRLGSAAVQASGPRLDESETTKPRNGARSSTSGNNRNACSTRSGDCVAPDPAPPPSPPPGVRPTNSSLCCVLATRQTRPSLCPKRANAQKLWSRVDAACYFRGANGLMGRGSNGLTRRSPAVRHLGCPYVPENGAARDGTL